MILINKFNDLRIKIKKSLITKIGKIATQHFPNEFGGFLIGRYSTDLKSVEIDDFILPKKYKGTPTLFQRSTDEITSLFRKEFELNNRYYIGEWHSHPNGSTMYSQTDLNAMIETVNCSTVTIKNPILLIISINNKKMNDFTFYCYSDKKLYNYE